MPGVSIKVKGNNNVGAVTDIDGAFTINVKRGTVLQFSFLGYNTKEEKATPGKIMQIVLEEDKKTLGEIVVVGYQPVRQRDLTGSVAKADVSSSPTLRCHQSTRLLVDVLPVSTYLQAKVCRVDR